MTDQDGMEPMDEEETEIAQLLNDMVALGDLYERTEGMNDDEIIPTMTQKERDALARGEAMHEKWSGTP